MQRACIILAFLGMASVARATTCPTNFANLTTCRILNGVSALGSGSQITSVGMRNLDNLANQTVAVGLSMVKATTECNAKMTEYSCVSATAGATTADSTGKMVPTYATPCNDDGTQMKPCRAWCIEIYKTCGKAPFDSEQMITAMCVDTTATTQCYGNDGVRGMRPGSATGSAGSSRPSTLSVVAPIAVAAAGLGVAR